MNSLNASENQNDDHNSKEMLHCLVKGATEYALILMNPQERITYWNCGAEKIFGYKEEEILGKSIFTIFTPEDVELGVARKELAKAAKDGSADDERWHRRKDGSRFWANGVVTSVRDTSGNLLGYSKVLRDQTLRKKTEDKLKSSVSELTQFNYVVSHDLQEPLRMVTLYLDRLQKAYQGKVDDAHDEYVKFAREGAHRLRTLLHDLLQYIRDDHSGPIERTDVAAVFDNAVSNLKVLIEETAATVTRTSFPVVQASSPQLVRVFQNLVENGIKYRRKDVPPKIYADAKPIDGYWLFSVCDNGIGIPKEQASSVFEAFSRLHSKDEYPGTGLGLFLCRKAIERHGGEIWVESDGHSGTQFHFTLPRTEKESNP